MPLGLYSLATSASFYSDSFFFLMSFSYLDSSGCSSFSLAFSVALSLSPAASSIAASSGMMVIFSHGLLSNLTSNWTSLKVWVEPVLASS
jgi:hypothetical protein